MKHEYALFVRKASRIENLKKPHLLKQEVPFLIEKYVMLNKDEYENFTSDLAVERQFIEDNQDHCYIDPKGIWHSIYVYRRGRTEGILVMSAGTDRPVFTASFDMLNRNINTVRIKANQPGNALKNMNR